VADNPDAPTPAGHCEPGRTGRPSRHSTGRCQEWTLWRGRCSFDCPTGSARCDLAGTPTPHPTQLLESGPADVEELLMGTTTNAITAAWFAPVTQLREGLGMPAEES